MVKKLFPILFLLLGLSSCYLFDPNVEVQFINNTELTIVSISPSAGTNTIFSDNILEAELQPNTTRTCTFSPDSYVFKFECSSLYTFYSNPTDLTGYDIYEFNIND